MNKNISNLNIPEENKILLTKISKRVSFLNNKSEEYFDNAKTVKSKNIEEAYAVNEDLISILNENKDLVNNLKDDSLEIRKKHQADFTREVTLTVTQQVLQSSIIKSTIEHKDNLITADEKMTALTKKKNYIKNRNNKRRIEMETVLDGLEKRIHNEDFLDIEPMKEDVLLIKKFIDPRLINRTRYLYLLTLVPLAFAIATIGGVLIWLV